ncbi:MAG: CsgG/HfaB family protein [Chitinivibrionales bacterium]
MKLIIYPVWSLMLLAFLSGLLIGCASTYSGNSIMETTDETEVQGCGKLGLITGNSYWGGFSGQKLSLEIAKKRALEQANTKGATRVLWTTMKKGFFGASVTGKAYVCSETTNPIAGNTDAAAKIIPVSKSLTPKKETASGYAAVMRFESISIDSGVSMVITDIFTNQIQANGKYRVMERSQMNKILSEQGFQSSGACNSTECAVEIGRLLSIDKMFIGSIGKLGKSWFINIRIVDIRTGEIVSNVSKQVMGKVENLSSAALQMANEFSQ